MTASAMTARRAFSPLSSYLNMKRSPLLLMKCAPSLTRALSPWAENPLGVRVVSTNSMFASSAPAPVAHGLRVAGIVGTVPAVERHPGGVERNPIDLAGGQHHGTGANREPRAGAEVESQRAADTTVHGEQFHRHRARQHRALQFAYLLANVFLEFGAVEVDVIGAGEAEGPQPVVVVVAWIPEIHAEALDPAQHSGHLVDHPAGDLHVDDAVSEFGDVLEQELGRVPFGTRLHDREIVIDAAAHAAAVVQDLSLFADDDIQAGFQGRNGRHAAGDAATDHQHVGVQV